MKVEISDTVDHRIFHVYVEKTLMEGAITESIDIARREIAKKIWEENADKIMAQMDLKGLAALVAIEASKALRK